MASQLRGDTSIALTLTPRSLQRQGVRRRTPWRCSERGVSVKAIDVSPLSCEAMRRRGIADVECINLFDPRLGGGFDTILMLMNGTGIAGKMSGLGGLLRRVASLLAPGGQILIDSSDLSYVYQDEDGGMDIDLSGKYYGEVDYQMRYDRVEGLPFDWLYVDYPLLSAAARVGGARLSARGRRRPLRLSGSAQSGENQPLNISRL